MKFGDNLYMEEILEILRIKLHFFSYPFTAYLNISIFLIYS